MPKRELLKTIREQHKNLKQPITHKDRVVNWVAHQLNEADMNNKKMNVTEK